MLFGKRSTPLSMISPLTNIHKLTSKTTDTEAVWKVARIFNLKKIPSKNLQEEFSDNLRVRTGEINEFYPFFQLKKRKETSQNSSFPSALLSKSPYHSHELGACSFRSYILWGYMSFLSKKAYQIKIRGMLKSWWTFSCWVCSFWGVWARFSQASKQFSTQNLFTNCLRLKVLQQRNSDASIRQMTPTEKEAWQWRAQRPWRQPVWGQSLAITVWPWANHLTSLGLTFLINEALLIRLSITYWTNYWM